jgi:hypothetical protein
MLHPGGLFALLGIVEMHKKFGGIGRMIESDNPPPGARRWA